jgi:hypothetical protein
MGQTEDNAGHRKRLRQRFAQDPRSLSESQLLELLLTFAIPRQDVAPLAEELTVHFGDFPHLLDASYEELQTVAGVGFQTAILIKLVAHLSNRPDRLTGQDVDPTLQPALRDIDEFSEPAKGVAPSVDETPHNPNGPDSGQQEDLDPVSKTRTPEVRTFANDEIANALVYIPKAAEFEDLAAFKVHLAERLPYNSASTRQRRANYITDRFLPDDVLHTPLTYYAARCATQEDLKPVLFYHVLQVELLVAKVAVEFIWPALPVGYIERETLREFILRYLPDASPATQTKILRSIYRTYDLLAVGVEANSTLHFRIRPGTFEAFLYIFTAEFPQPGIYTFDTLETGPLRHWLLWDREWIRRQLYNLRDLGIVTKVSEIDTVRQFSLQMDQRAALQHYFELPNRRELVLRED